MRFENISLINYIKYLSFSSTVALMYIIFTIRGSTNETAMYISIGLLVIWIVIAFLSQPKVLFSSLTTRPVILFIVFLLFYMITAVFNGGLIYTAKLMGASLIIFSPLMLFEYYRRIDLNRLKAIVVISIFFVIYLIFKALTFYSINENAARRLASNELAYGDVAIGGGYAMAYALTILSIYLFDLLLNKKIRLNRSKFIVIFFLLISNIFIIETESTLTILCLFLGYIISFLNKNNYSKDKRSNYKMKMLFYLKFLSSIFFSILILLNRKAFGIFILNVTSGNSDILSLRVRDIGYALTSGIEESGQVALRLEIPMRSVKAFLSNPIIGRGYEYGYRAVEAHKYVGGHGEWVDALGKYGIIGALLFFFIFVYFIKNEREISNELIPSTYVIVFVLLGIFNPLVNFQSMFILLFLIPSLTLMLTKRTNTK